MLDLGWQEFVMVGLVLILVVGPKAYASYS